jgi:hypothetical protein
LQVTVSTFRTTGWWYSPKFAEPSNNDFPGPALTEIALPAHWRREALFAGVAVKEDLLVKHPSSSVLGATIRESIQNYSILIDVHQSLPTGIDFYQPLVRRCPL